MAANRDNGKERNGTSAAGGKESVLGYLYSTTTKKSHSTQSHIYCAGISYVIIVTSTIQPIVELKPIKI